jgi:diacylglycerol kinase (ATP)
MEQPLPPRRHSGQSLGHSFYCAIAGLVYLIRTQRNAQIHGIATGVVLMLGIWLQLPAPDWCWLVIAMSSVWATEALNTAVEILADRVTTERDESIRRTKDLAAGGVLVMAIGAFIIGFLILWKPLLERLG